MTGIGHEVTTREVQGSIMPDRVIVIVNAGAGSEPAALPLDEAFRAQGVNVDLRIVQSPADLVPTIERAISERPSRLAAAGGDGTISTVAAHLAGTSIALGVLPLGTLNHFARDAGIPVDLEGAISTIVHGRVIEVDIARVNGHYFLNNSSLGIYPHIVRVRERQQSRLHRGKWPAFASAALRVFRRSAFVRLQLERDGRVVHLRTPLVFVGNNRYILEGFSIGQRSGLQDGVLTVCVARVHSRWGLILLALRALFGQARGDPQLEVFTTTSILVGSRRRTMLVAMDGEVRPMEPPLHYSVVAGALRVLVPAE